MLKKCMDDCRFKINELTNRIKYEQEIVKFQEMFGDEQSLIPTRDRKFNILMYENDIKIWMARLESFGEELVLEQNNLTTAYHENISPGGYVV